MHYEALKEVWGELTAPGAPFEVASVDVGGVPVKAFKNAPANVRELWLSSAQFGRRDYLVYQDERITYAEAHKRTAAIAAWLLREGVTPGDRIAIAMRNYPEWLLAYWAAVSIGVAVVGMNAWWVADEVEYALNDSEPKIVFCDHERLERILERPASAHRAQAGRRAHRDACRRASPPGRTWSLRRPRCRRWTSIPTPTPASSTPRAPPAGRRARS